jgi:hypothetical protein
LELVVHLSLNELVESSLLIIEGTVNDIDGTAGEVENWLSICNQLDPGSERVGAYLSSRPWFFGA